MSVATFVIVGALGWFLLAELLLPVCMMLLLWLAFSRVA
jgi:hypothetical protein